MNRPSFGRKRNSRSDMLDVIQTSCRRGSTARAYGASDSSGESLGILYVVYFIVFGLSLTSAPSPNAGIQSVPLASNRNRRGPLSGGSNSFTASVFGSTRPTFPAQRRVYQTLPSVGLTSMPYGNMKPASGRFVVFGRSMTFMSPDFGSKRPTWFEMEIVNQVTPCLSKRSVCGQSAPPPTGKSLNSRVCGLYDVIVPPSADVM